MYECVLYILCQNKHEKQRILICNTIFFIFKNINNVCDFSLNTVSFLTSDFFSVTVAVVLFDAHLIALYFVAFAIIISCLVVYNIADRGV